MYTAPSANFYDYDGLIHGDLGNPFTKYQIKMKDSIDYRCWITDWPRILSRSLESIGEPRLDSIDSDTYVKTKFECNLPIDAFQKINYAIEFYEKEI